MYLFVGTQVILLYPLVHGRPELGTERCHDEAQYKLKFSV